MAYENVFIDLSEGKFSNKTITLGKKGKNGEITDTEIIFSNKGDYSIEKEVKGNDIIITAYDGGKVLGKVTVKNGAKQEFIEGGYSAWLSVNGGSNWTNLFTASYDLGDECSYKSQTLKGTALNENFHGGFADDKMYSGGGSDTFHIYKGDAIGKTGDIIYGSDGDDTLNLIDEEDWSGYTLYKEGDNLRLNAGKDNITIDKYFANAEDNRIQGIDMEEYMDDSYIQVVGDKKKANKLVGSEYDDEIYGGDKNDTIITGDGDDKIYGGNGNDNITINSLGDKYIYVDKGGGNDVVDIDLSHPMLLEKTKATVPSSTPYSPAVYDTDGDLRIYATIGVDRTKSESDKYFYFTKRGADIIIEAAHIDDGTSESLTLKNYFNLSGTVQNIISGVSSEYKSKVSDPTNYDLYINGESANYYLNNAELNIEGVKVTDLIKMVEKEFPSNMNDQIDGVLKKIKIPSGLANANVYLGSSFNDSMEGSNNKDVMLSLGGEYNSFVTGTKGQTVAASLGKDSNDYYGITNFEAGTLIYDNGGSNDVEIYNVDTNDIHIIGGSMGGTYALKEAKEPSLVKASVPTTSTTAIEILTDSKGLKNIENIDFADIGKKINDIKEAFSGSEKKGSTESELVTSEQAKAINSALTIANSLIEKFRGVAIVSRKEVEELYGPVSILAKGTSDEKAPAVASNLYDDMWVRDKKGIWHCLTAESQEAAAYLMYRSLSDFSDNLDKKFGINMGDMMQVLIYPDKCTISANALQERLDNYEIDNAFIKKYYKKVDNDTYIFSNTAINEMKSSLISVFQNTYVGTNYDNNFSVSHSDSGAAIATGYGNDTITFNGEIGSTYNYDKPYAYSPDTAPKYNIASSLESYERDTLVFKNYTYGKDLRLEYIDMDIDSDGQYVNGLQLETYKATKNTETEAYINYHIGEDVDGPSTGFNIHNNRFALTLKDKSNTYQITAEHSSNYGVEYDWTGSKDGHVAYIFADDIEIQSNKATNYIYADRAPSDTKGSYSELYYTYGGGTDFVNSVAKSYDSYFVNLTNKTHLTILDEGQNDEDTLYLQNADAGKLKLFFNVKRNGDILADTDDGIGYGLIAGNISKSTFEISKFDAPKKYYYSSEEITGYKNGVEFDYNLTGTQNGIEEIYFNDGESRVYGMDSLVNNIRSDVASWLNTNNYYDAEEAILNGSAKEVKELFAIYNSYNINDYSGSTYVA